MHAGQLRLCCQPQGCRLMTHWTEVLVHNLNHAQFEKPAHARHQNMSAAMERHVVHKKCCERRPIQSSSCADEMLCMHTLSLYRQCVCINVYVMAAVDTTCCACSKGSASHQSQSRVVRVHSQRLMNRVHDDIQTPHEGGGSSCNLDSQDNGSIPDVGAQIKGLCNSDVQIETKGAEVQKGDDAAVKAELPCSPELVWGDCSSCRHIGVGKKWHTSEHGRSSNKQDPCTPVC